MFDIPISTQFFQAMPIFIRPSSPFAITKSEKWLRTFQALLWTQTGIQVIFSQTLLHSPDKLSHKIVKLEVNLFGNNTLSFAFLLQSNGVPLHWMSNCLNILFDVFMFIFFHSCANIDRLVFLSAYSKLCFFGRPINRFVFVFTFKYSNNPIYWFTLDFNFCVCTAVQ